MLLLWCVGSYQKPGSSGLHQEMDKTSCQPDHFSFFFFFLTAGLTWNYIKKGNWNNCERVELIFLCQLETLRNSRKAERIQPKWFQKHVSIKKTHNESRWRTIKSRKSKWNEAKGETPLDKVAKGHAGHKTGPILGAQMERKNNRTRKREKGTEMQMARSHRQNFPISFGWSSIHGKSIESSFDSWRKSIFIITIIIFDWATNLIAV